MVIFIEILSKRKTGDFVLVGLHLSVELPFYRVGLIIIEMIFLEDGHAVVGIAGGEITATVGCNDLEDCIRAVLLVAVGHLEVTR